MDEDILEEVARLLYHNQDNKRKFGMGIPLFKLSAEMVVRKFLR